MVRHRILFVIAILLLGCDTVERSQHMQNAIDGQVVIESGTFPTERTDNGGLIVHDGDVTLLIENFGRNSSLIDLAGIRSTFLQTLRATPQFGRQMLPETEFATGDSRGFKYVTLGRNGKTERASYILEVRGGSVIVHIGNDNADCFDEHEYEESLLPTIRIE